MIDRADIKRFSKEALKDTKWALILVGFIIYMAIGGACSTLMGIGIILAYPLELGLILMIKKVLSGKEVDFNLLFNPYKDLNKAVNFSLSIFVSQIFICLWSLLFVIPGIVKAYSYSAVPYLFSMNPDLKPIEAIDESKRLMNGHKWEAFVFDLSFIPHFLLAIITLGIYLIYLIPYYATCKIEFYRRILNDNLEEDEVLKTVDDLEF